jgi:O-antigen ligase
VKPARSSRRPRESPLEVRLGVFFLWLVVLVPPFLLAPVAFESFRQPKLLAGEWLALASLVCLAWGARRTGVAVRPAELWSLPAVRLVLPMLLVATAGLALTRHPVHARDALIDLWIGAAALVGWSAAVPGSRLERLLRGLLWPATALGAIAILQFHDLWQPLQFLGMAPASRLAVTSLAGNPGDLGAYLVLPSLVAQEALRRRLREGGWGRPAVWGVAVALAVCVYGLLLTQTLAAVVALLAGSLLFWGSRLPRRLVPGLLAVGALATALLVTAVPPLRHRVVEKVHQAAAGNWGAVLSGRPDGWRAAVWMLERHPLTGVGHGGYLPEFVPAKLALLDRGVPFDLDPTLGVFANAHNELLTVGAEWGVPGLLAVVWALWVLLGALRRLPPEERVLAGAGIAALVVLALVDFPFHVALVAYPALLFLSWVVHRPAGGGEPAGEGAGRGRALATVLTAFLAVALMAQAVRWRDVALANRLLGSVQRLSMAMASTKQAPPQLVAQNLAALRRAAPLDPVQVGIPITRGGQYLFFLNRPEEAERSYQEALRLEPRPEVYMGLGKAQWLAGRREEAARNFGLALRLNPFLARELPTGAPQ